MRQNNTILELKGLLLANTNVKTALLYGSFGRQKQMVNSDIDIAIVVNDQFEIDEFLTLLKEHFATRVINIFHINLRNKIVIYFQDIPKTEIAYSKKISEHFRNYLGSEISIDKISESILFDRTKKASQQLLEITKNSETSKTENVSNEILSSAYKFIYEFESSSNAHRRSDGYHFYFFYNIALQAAIQINHLGKGQAEFNFLPKNYISSSLSKEEQKKFYDLRGTLFLPEANQQKRKLLDFFYSSLENVINRDVLIELKQFCETIYNRDFLWNFRDISFLNTKIKSGKIYRTASMTLFQNEVFFEEFLAMKKIKTVIDLRAEREIKENAYSDKSLSKFQWIHSPLDSWSQSIEFQATHHQGTNIEIAYRYFTLECKDSIKKSIEAILQEEEACAIHCHAGKDRTGILITLLHLLSGADKEVIYNDYLASEIDTKKEYIDMVLGLIDKEKGIKNYLLSCGLQENQLKKLGNKIFTK